MSQALTILSTARDGLSLAALAQETPASLRARLRTWYHEAYAENFVVQLQLLAELNGVADSSGQVFTYVDTGAADGHDVPITIIFNKAKMSVAVKNGEKIVCDNSVAGHEMLLPGKWIRTVVESIAAAEAGQQARANRQALTEHHQILTLFASED